MPTDANNPKLRPFQEEGVRQMLGTLRCVNADEMGLGKTAQAIAATQRHHSDPPYLIVCPKAVRFNWERELDKWGAVGAIGHIQGIKEDESQWVLCDWIICSDNLLAKRGAELPVPNVLICDEAHKFKNPEAKRTRALRKIIGAMEAKAPVWLLTGTPLCNRPLELWTLLQLMGHSVDHEWAHKWYYANRYCGPDKVWTGRKYVTQYKGASNLKELHGHLRKHGVFIRRKKVNVLHELPEKSRHIIKLDAPVPVADTRDCPARQMALLETIKRGLVDDENPDFQALSGVRAQQGMSKLPYAVDYLLATSDDVPTLVLCYHKDFADKMAKSLGMEAAIHGGTSENKRERLKNAFMAGETNFLVATIQTIGTGVDGLQQACNRAVFCELSYLSTELAQTEDRLWRMGQERAVTIEYLIAPGSLDEFVWDILLEKIRIIEAVVDGVATGEEEEGE